MEKTAVITNCRFSSIWNNPKGGIVYYHELTMQNGDVGSIGTMDKLPKRIEIGTEITYEISPEKKIKIIQSTEFQKPKPQTSNYPTKMNNYTKKPEEFLGYVFGYAKDLVCSKINAKEKGIDASKETIKIAKELYAEIKIMLQEQ